MLPSEWPEWMTVYIVLHDTNLTGLLYGFDNKFLVDDNTKIDGFGLLFDVAVLIFIVLLFTIFLFDVAHELVELMVFIYNLLALLILLFDDDVLEDVLLLAFCALLITLLYETDILFLYIYISWLYSDSFIL